MTKHPLSIFRNLTLKELELRQSRFATNTTATNWSAVLEAMLTLQQLDYAMRSPTIDMDKLVSDLRGTSNWPDVICRATIGLTCTEALA